MVPTNPPTSKGTPSHRRSRSQTTVCSQSPIWNIDEPRYTLKSRSKRAQSFLSYSDPVEPHLFDSSPLLHTYSGHLKGRGEPKSRKSHKKTRHTVAYFGRKESLRVSQPRTRVPPSPAGIPFSLAASAPTPSPLQLPSTPNAFHLSSSVRRAPPLRSKTELDQDHVHQIQSDYQEAFGQLRRSLEDGDERFILRMQEWEQRNAAPQTQIGTPEEIPSHNDHGSSKQASDELRFDDDDVEIVVYSDVSPPMPYAERGDGDRYARSSASLHHKPSYESFMEEDWIPDDSASLSQSQYSAASFSNGLPSSTSTSMDGPSSSSSMVSIPSPIEASIYHTQTKSDRAIAALSLALANGAAGLEDYHAILQAQGNMSGCDAGSLWD